MIYEIHIPTETDCLEDFEKDNDNIALFRVFDEQNKDISEECVYVEMWLSKNGMIGLGTALIRLAHNFEKNKEIFIAPSSKEKGTRQSMGIFLTPDSSELVICCADLGLLDDYVK